ncbi:putative gag-pol poly protein [Ilyonectria robusta]
MKENDPTQSRVKKTRAPDSGQEDTTVRVNTMYKRKADKVQPRDDVPSDGSTPEGDPFWRDKKWDEVKGNLEKDSPFSDYITPKFSKIKKGSRLFGERLDALMGQTKDTLNDAEREIFRQIIFNREEALAWTFEEKGELDPRIAPPQVIKITPHTAWQCGNVVIPHGTKAKVIQLLKERLKNKIIEESHASYRNWWMLVAKKDGGLRLINSAKRYNAYTIRDGMIPPGTEDFSAEFGMYREAEGDIEDEIDARLNLVLFGPEDKKLEDSYTGEWLVLGNYLTSLKRPKGLSARDFSRLRKKATQFYVHGGHIWRRALSLGDDPTLVVDDEELQKHLIITSHHHGGHKGREATVHIVSRRYFWRGIRRKVESIIKTCPICQVHAAQRPAEIAKPTTPWYPMMKIHIDGQYLPDDDGMKFLLEARCDLTGWVEAMPCKALNAANVRKFIRRILYRYGMPVKIVTDNGSELAKGIPDELDDLGITMAKISFYNSKSNGLIEVGHISLVNYFKKLGRLGKWVGLVDQALFADRSTIRGSHGCSPFWLLHGWEPILPMEVKVPTWRLIDWDEVHTREDIVLARIRILERRQEDREAARQKVKEYRENLARKTTASNAFKLRKKPLSLGDLVLLYDVKNYHDLSTAAKLKPKWRGPYRIREALAETRTYILESLDGVKMAGTCHGDRIKAFVKDDQGWWASPDDAEVWGPPTEDEDEESEEEPSHDKTYQPSEAEDPSDDAYSAPVLRPRRGPRGDFQVRIPEMRKETHQDQLKSPVPIAKSLSRDLGSPTTNLKVRRTASLRGIFANDPRARTRVEDVRSSQSVRLCQRQLAHTPFIYPGAGGRKLDIQLDVQRAAQSVEGPETTNPNPE